MFKAYALLWKRCVKSIQNKISTREDFENMIYNNPIRLLKAIKEHSLNFQETRYEMSIILDTLRAFLNLKQKKNENLHEYTQRFKTTKGILESPLGRPFILEKSTKQMDEYSEKDIEMKTKLNKEASDNFFAFLYL